MGNRGQHSEGSLPTYNPSDTRLELLRLLIGGASYKTISKKLNIRKYNISKAKRLFLDKGLIEERAGSIYATSIGVTLIQRHLARGEQGQQILKATEMDKDRLHRLTFTIYLTPQQIKEKNWKKRRQLILEAKKIEYLPTRIGESFYIEDINIQTTSRGVVFRGIEAFGYDGTDCKGKSIEMLKTYIPKVENLLGIKLEISNLKTRLYCGSQEHAFIWNVWATQILEAKKNGLIGEFEVLNEDGELVAIVDNSRGIPELEFVHKIEAQDHADAMKREIHDIITGKNRVLKDKIGQYEDRIARLEATITRLTATQEKLTDLMQKPQMKQPTLKDFQPDYIG